MTIEEQLTEALRERDEARRLLELAHLGRAQLEGWRDGLERERDEWRDKFHALNQTAGELCNACGWAFKIPGEPCRCEVVKERDEARAEVERQRELKDYLRTWLSSEELEGLRVKAAEHPLLWEEIHHLKAEVERLREMAHDFEAMREDRDEARAEVERLVADRKDVQKVRAALEVLIVKTQNELVAARAKAETCERDWYAAKADFGTAMGKMREALRAAEKRELEALAELDEARASAADQFRRGAEAMREACLGVVERFMDFGSPHPGMIAHKMSALPIPEEP